MLQELKLKNFQSHSDSVVTFSENVTAIIGHNNHGKSAIFRALYKAVRNKPGGTSFIRDYTDTCTITCSTDLGVVSRTIKNNSAVDANSYIVTPKDSAPLPFNKFGKTGIPDEVLAVLNISAPQKFGEVELDINFQTQLGDLFLMVGDGLPSLRGKVLGRITGVDQVQRAIQLASASEKEAVRLANAKVEDINDLQTDLRQYAKLEQYQATYHDIKQLEGQLHEKIKLVNKIKEIRDQIVTVVQQASTLKTHINTLKDLDINILIQLKSKQAIKSSLYSLLESNREISRLEVISNLRIPSVVNLRGYIRQRDLCQRLRAIIASQNDNLRLTQMELPDVSPLKSKYTYLSTLTSKRLELDNYLNLVSHEQSLVQTVSDNIVVAQAEVTTALSQLRRCPECGQVIKESAHV